VVIASSVLLAGMLVLGGAAAVHAAGTPAPSADDGIPNAPAADADAPSAVAPAAPTTRDAVPSPPAPTSPTAAPGDDLSPTITTPSDGDVLSGTLTISGTAAPGARLQISRSGSSDPLCSVTADSSGAWSCAVDALPSSASTTLTALERLPDGQNPSTAITVSVLNAPVVTGGPRGRLTNGVVQGTAFPGGAVTASAAGYSCQSTADASGAWSCPLSGITDGSFSVTAVQQTSWSGGLSPASGAMPIDVDTVAPPAPVLLSPAPGDALPTAGATFRGTGENGATVSVFAGPYTLCQTIVLEGTWSCSAASIPAGTYVIAVLQQDPAGNVGVQTATFTAVFGAAGTPGGTPTPSGSAVTPPPSTDGGDGSQGSSSAPGDTGTPGEGNPSPGPSSGGGGDGDDGAVPPGATAHLPGAWSDATRFSADLQPAIGGASGPMWWIAFAIGAAVILLVALPARLLSSVGPAAFGTRRAARAVVSVFGRNRSDDDVEAAPAAMMNPILAGVGALVAATAVSVLAGPVDNQPAYARLFLAALAALVVVNASATVLPGFLARAAFGIQSTLRITPALLLVSVGFTLVSRFADLDPALLFGVVLGVAVADTASRGDRGRLGVVQVLSLLAVGAVAWLVSGAVATSPVSATADAWAAGLSEFLHIVVLASFGASAVLLVPVGRMAGRRIFEWSPATWVVLTLSSFTALAMLFVPAVSGARSNPGVLGLLVVVVAFAAVSVSAWVWVRFVADEDDSADADE
jgi:hypothetical protein